MLRYAGNETKTSLPASPGNQASGSEQSAQAALANPEEATLLNIEPGRPVLRFERLSFDANEEPIEFVTSTYLSDK
jgi:DNA-binding GntR family transcriptional regulator